MGILSKILSGLLGLAGIAVLYLRGSLAKEKSKALEGELKREEASSEASSRATEALIKGMEDEAKPITRNGRVIK